MNLYQPMSERVGVYTEDSKNSKILMVLDKSSTLSWK